MSLATYYERKVVTSEGPVVTIRPDAIRAIIIDPMLVAGEIHPPCVIVFTDGSRLVQGDRTWIWTSDESTLEVYEHGVGTHVVGETK